MMSYCVLALMLSVTWLTEQQPGVAQTLRLAEQRTVQGMVEISAASDSSLVFVSVDVTHTDGKRDGNIEVMYTIELKPGVEKPRAGKAIGTVSFKSHESLQIKSEDGRLDILFSRAVPDSANSVTRKPIVDLTEGRRSQRAVGIQTHAELARQLSGAMKQLPRRPPGP